MSNLALSFLQDSTGEACSPSSSPCKSFINITFDIEAAQAMSAVRLSASHSKSRTISLVTTSLHLSWLHLALCVDYELWVLDVSPGVVYACHGVPRIKILRRKLLR